MSQERVIEILPALKLEETRPHAEQVNIDSPERDVTRSDLMQLNNYMDCLSQALSSVRTINGLATLALTATKLIECRRHVLKMPYGQAKAVALTARSIEVLE